MKPRHVVDEVRRLSRTSRSALCFYWVASRGDRDKFAKGLQDQSADLPLCPIVVRMGGFVDANAVASDLLRVIESARSELLQPGFAERLRKANRLDVVLIARRELELDSSSSPIVLPSWFPVFPSTSVTATIADLTWSTHVSLRADELHAGEIRRLIFELDRELARNLRASHERDHRLVNSFHEALRLESDGNIPFTELLSNADAALDRVTSPRDYRPSTVRNFTFVGRLWRLANTTPADGLGRVAKHVVHALDLSVAEVSAQHESIVTVLGRPSSPIEDPVRRWGFNLIVSIRAACQLITAAAHADEYAEYTLPLVRSISRDIRVSLDESVRTLAAQPRTRRSE